ncbi:hypothetical protein NEOLEDRAFT_1143522 [Neolentinus lepideus HHB14362 ss-1]|uniref:C3H1-type domain-containing protein n=1 Tax=Neolentinus lepideus HHB14362 ss-1 TaxID=1314782 RepID=A0A165MH62_9AGAM|nr:hypothetical protein NEOLEDRAFT_1143522 [Neolentinus lepideus HHB14362 ss-1]
MTSPSTSDAALKLEIARLTASINNAKSAQHPRSNARQPPIRSNVYVNPNYKPPSSSMFRPAIPTPLSSTVPSRPSSVSAEKKEVVIGGVAFESSGRSLVRKDLPKPAPAPVTKPPSRPPRPRSDYNRNTAGHLINTSRQYKPRSSRSRVIGRPNRNMTLNNNVRPYQARKVAKRQKYLDKPCPRFTTTGSCPRGLTCPYQHDPDKVAICWPFLHGTCTNAAETCNLSHNPTPERTPVCIHFANQGRCTRENCPYPHVRLGPRQGVCRDFAVLGYCEKGLDCDKNHVRECPDFAEKGSCETKGCKLPHVIRANRNRKAPAATAVVATDTSTGNSDSSHETNPDRVSAEQAQIGDEYISLTFQESDDTDVSDEDVDDDSDDDVGDDKEGDGPTEEEHGMYVHG